MDPTILSERNLLDLTMRLSIAIVAGGSIGLDRYIQHQAGGLRTHMLVSLGAALFAIVPTALTDRTDIDSLSRIVQGIAAGVGCLGAGEILHTASTSTHQDPAIRVTGLTSAASIWVTAAIGVIAGCGLWQVAIVATVMMMILSVLKCLERRNRV